MKVMALSINPTFNPSIPMAGDLSQQLKDLIQQYRATFNNPGEQRKILEEIKDFLEKNKALIEEGCFMNGWSDKSPDWRQHYDSFFKETVFLIDQAEYDPQTSHGLFFDSINEGLTQLDWLMSNHKRFINWKLFFECAASLQRAFESF